MSAAFIFKNNCFLENLLSTTSHIEFIHGFATRAEVACSFSLSFVLFFLNMFSLSLSLVQYS